MWWILLYSILEATYVLNKSQHGSVLTFIYYEKMPVYETGNASFQPHFLLNVTCLPPFGVRVNISIEILSLIIPSFPCYWMISSRIAFCMWQALHCESIYLLEGI